MHYRIIIGDVTAKHHTEDARHSDLTRRHGISRAVTIPPMTRIPWSPRKIDAGHADVTPCQKRFRERVVPGQGQTGTGGATLKPGSPGRIRIIGGRWRGRKIVVADAPGLRPSPDRVRETLFNWLAPYLDGARCLDLFAGTGVLGFEALSRGAAEVVFVDRDRDRILHLREQARMLGADTAAFVQADARAWLQNDSAGFDLVFLDPPFGQNLLGGTCEMLANRGHLRPGAIIYVEGEAGTALNCDGFEITRQARAGRVEFMLLEYRRLKE